MYTIASSPHFNAHHPIRNQNHFMPTDPHSTSVSFLPVRHNDDHIVFLELAYSSSDCHISPTFRTEQPLHANVMVKKSSEGRMKDPVRLTDIFLKSHEAPSSDFGHMTQQHKKHTVKTRSESMVITGAIDWITVQMPAAGPYGHTPLGISQSR